MRKITLSLLLGLVANLFYCTAQTVAGGGNHSLFICDNGTVRATGRNVNGQLGNGTNSNTVVTPVTVSGLTDVVAVAAKAEFSLFLKSDGTVWACGSNTYGELGNGTNQNSNIPVQVPGLTGIVKISAGFFHSLFLKNDGTVWACGRNFSGELGNGNQNQQNTPVQATGLTNIVDIAAGDNHSIFVDSNGTVKVCGDNQNGALGLGNSFGPVVAPATVAITNVVAVAAGMRTSVFIKEDGTAWVSGINTYGQLGDGSTNEKLIPTQVMELSGITAAATGQYHILYLKNDGTVWGCGYNALGQLGIGNYDTFISTPVQISGFSNVVSIAGSGYYHSVFAKNDNTFYACGQNGGALGDGTGNDSNIPTVVIANCTSLSAEEITATTLVKAYPNPVSEVIHFTTALNNITLYDLSGRQVAAENSTNTVNVSGLAAGRYLAKGSTADKESITITIIKN
jgi:alpha-tubulin suppressor-like RCC1 family protein